MFKNQRRPRTSRTEDPRSRRRRTRGLWAGRGEGRERAEDRRRRGLEEDADDEGNLWWPMRSKMVGAPALVKFVFWWTSIIAAPSSVVISVGAIETARLWSPEAFALHRAGRRTLPSPLPLTSMRRGIGTSPGPSLLQATKQSDTWELRYKELVKYKEEHGDCDVPQSMGALGDWVFNQRISYTKGSLAKERVGILDDIGFTWRFVATDGAAVLSKLHYYDELWDWRYRELKEYREKHGDCNVSYNQGSLGKWVGRQRNSYKKGKLSDERIARLKGIGFVWDQLEQQWFHRFDELTNYKGENGDCNIPRRQGPLGEWVSTQRKDYKEGKMSKERVYLLESISFVWEPLDEVWMAHFDELVDFKKENGDCNVSANQGPLGKW
ncbi:hypothetical protein THAOC_04560, partial [Thalassiosira oceanica]